MKNFLSFALVLLFGTGLYSSLQAQYYGVSPSVVGEWALGVQAGASYLRGDIPQDRPGYHLGVYGQNAFSRSMDFKFMLEGGRIEGQGTTPSQAFLYNTALNGTRDSVYFYDTSQVVYHNYQLRHYALSGALKLNLNRLFSPDGGDRVDVFLLGGLSLMLYETRINLYDEANEQIYDYNQITASEPMMVQTQLAELMDDTYESLAEQDQLNNTLVGNKVFRSSFFGGGGLRLRLGDHVGLGLEARYQLILDDLLDGQQWTEDNEPSRSNDNLITAGLTLDYIF